jgi:hypothetical protein
MTLQPGYVFGLACTFVLSIAVASYAGPAQGATPASRTTNDPGQEGRPAQPNLFTNIDALGPVAMIEPLSANAKRRTFATMDTRQLRETATGDGVSSVTLNLFADVVVTAEKQRFEQRTAGDFTWVGSVADSFGSSIILTVVEGTLTGSVLYDGNLYRIRPTRAGNYEISEVDGRSFASDHGPQLQEVPPGHRELQESDGIAVVPSPPTTVTINIGVVYNWAAKAAVPGIQGEIQHGVDLTNEAFANSGILIHLNLSATGVVSYAHADSELLTDLYRLQNPSDDYLDYVHELRDNWAWRADIMTLVVDNGATGYCGRGFIFDKYILDKKGFNVVNIHCLASNLSLAHEVGHNLGGLHDWAVDQTPSKNHGHVLVQAQKRTIMAYPDACVAFECPKILHFSNPQTLFNGVPTGVGSQGLYPADNRQGLNSNRWLVALFR